MLNSPPLTWIVQVRRLAERDDARVEPMNERAEREEIEVACIGNMKGSGHNPRTL